MMKVQLPCLLGDDSCQFITIQLEFSQAKEIIEMHMKLVHPVPVWRKFECDNCEKDNATKDIIEDKVDEETSCNVQNDTVCEDSEIFQDNSEPVESVQVAKAVKVATEEEEALLQSDIADVTSVRDDRDEVGNHSVKPPTSKSQSKLTPRHMWRITSSPHQLTSTEKWIY